MSRRALPKDLASRLEQLAREWRLSLEETFETETSVISYVNRDGQTLVLKVVKQVGDEWNGGAVLDAFNGNGVVRVYDYEPGAMLLERLEPASALSDEEDDVRATEILAEVIAKISPRQAPANTPTVEDWHRRFDRYLDKDDTQIPRSLIESASDLFARLSASQRQTHLLHGDLQHYNVLLDANRGWVAIDPKGVIGETEYEIGAVLRNPIDRPESFLSSVVIKRRLEQFSNYLSLDYEKMLAWSFAQAVLSAIWLVEDGHTVSATDRTLQLAEVLGSILK